MNPQINANGNPRHQWILCAVGLAVCALGATSSASAANPTTASHPQVVTKAKHVACARRAARLHRRAHCPHSTVTLGPGASTTQPYADYRTPGGPLVPVATATARAEAVANTDNEPMPIVVSVVMTTVGQEAAALGVATNAYPASPGYAAYLASPEYVVVMHGNFTLNNAQGTPGLPLPRGTVLLVTIDAHTGQDTSARLGP